MATVASKKVCKTDAVRTRAARIQDGEDGRETEGKRSCPGSERFMGVKLKDHERDISWDV